MRSVTEKAGLHSRVRKTRGRGSERWDFPFQQQRAVRPDVIRSLGTHSVSLQPVALLLQQSLASRFRMTRELLTTFDCWQKFTCQQFQSRGPRTGIWNRCCRQRCSSVLVRGGGISSNSGDHAMCVTKEVGVLVWERCCIWCTQAHMALRHAKPALAFCTLSTTTSYFMTCLKQAICSQAVHSDKAA